MITMPRKERWPVLPMSLQQIFPKALGLNLGERSVWREGNTLVSPSSACGPSSPE